MLGILHLLKLHHQPFPCKLLELKKARYLEMPGTLHMEGIHDECQSLSLPWLFFYGLLMNF